ncbi:hypothetical protein FKG94_00515 [Exilibacterium tricleocarpae]|uniref:Peptidase C-terminal archaeal/bacterial domain-containing protein n=1 Tax=Exilibacterium tricleocarpae TaxID=2591008 RepID=A0A545U9D5_9GAMM|nr:hypothetical protein [Exilibacterium tricleocarpae]TQV86077.1 hypothetical protein FKG94_00515 [Exilibacterium tricleocarpae]
MRMHTGKVSNIVLAALLWCLPLTASFAGGPLKLNPNDPDNFSRWPNGGVNIPYNPDLGGLGPLSNDEAVQQTAAAFQRWQDIDTATATYSNNGPLPFDVNVTNFLPFIKNLLTGNNNADGLSPIVYDEDGAIFTALFGASRILGFAAADTFDSDGVPIEGVAFLNGGAINRDLSREEFLAVQVHAFGHYSGLAHSVVNGQSIVFGDAVSPAPISFGLPSLDELETMYPFLIPGAGQARLHADDIAFYSTLYPVPDFFARRGSISGTIYASDGVTPLSGVNVVARRLFRPFLNAVSAISGDRGVPGAYTIGGLTPGARYVLYIDELMAGSFSTTPLRPLPGVEEFYNGANESNDSFIDNPTERELLIPVAGTEQTGIDITLNATLLPGEPLPLDDRSFVQVFLPFAFTLCGQDFSSVFINADGSLTFGRDGLVAFRLLPEFLAGPPRIAGLWKDLDPAQGGSVIFTTGPDRFSVHWINVPESIQGGANSFTITLKRKLPGSPFGNAFSVTYGSLTAEAGISGYSCGGKVTSRVETSSDLSAEAPFIFKSLFKTAVFEDFTRAGSATDLIDTPLFYPGTRRFRDRFEPNDTFSTARRIHLPFNSEDTNRRYTAIEPRGDDVDYYRFHARAGQSVIVELLSGSFTPVLGLFDASGNRVAFKEPFGIPTSLVYEVPDSGTYALAIGASPDTELTGNGLGDGRYVMNVFSVEGRVLNLRDESSEEVELDFSFPFQGQNWDSVFVNSNGNLTFGSPDLSFPSAGNLLSGPPRIAQFWADLDPGSQGLVTANVQSATATITFSNVPLFPITQPNTFAVTLNANGSIAFDYGDLDDVTTPRLVGISEGGGAVDPGSTDLSGAANFPVSGTTYEEFGSNNALDLEDTLITFD